LCYRESATSKPSCGIPVGRMRSALMAPGLRTPRGRPLAGPVAASTIARHGFRWEPDRSAGDANELRMRSPTCLHRRPGRVPTLTQQVRSPCRSRAARTRVARSAGILAVERNRFSPLWQDRPGASTGRRVHYLRVVTPRDHIYDCACDASRRGAVPFRRSGRSLRPLAERALNAWTIARLDLATRLLAPGHPVRQRSERDDRTARGRRRRLRRAGRGARRMEGVRVDAEMGPRPRLNLAADVALAGYGKGVLHLLRAPSAPSRNNLRGERVLITGVGGGLGRD